MSSQTTSVVRYSPVRIGFLVRNGRIDDLVRAAELNTIVWGGIFNPLIPVSPNADSISDDLIAAFQVDVLCSVVSAPETDALSLRYPCLTLRPGALNSMLAPATGTGQNQTTVLDLIDIGMLYWNRDFKHKPIGFTSNHLLLDWPNSDPLASLFSLAFGRFPSTTRMTADYRTFFVQALRATTKGIASSSELPHDIAGSISPIASTRSELKNYRSSVGRGGVFVGDATEFDDLINFWNMRASGNPVRFLAIGYESVFRPFLQTHLGILDRMPAHNAAMQEHIAFYCGPMNVASAHSFAQSFDSQTPTVVCPVPHRFCPDERAQMEHLEFGYEFVSSTIEKSGTGYALHVGLPEKRFLADVERTRFRHFAVTVKPASEIGPQGYTVRPPEIRALHDSFCGQMMPHARAPHIRGREYRQMVRGVDHRVSISPMPHDKVISEVFQKIGYTAKLSTAGRLAHRITEQLGGIGQTKVFKIRGVRDLIRSVGPLDSLTRASAKKTIWSDGQFRDHEGLYIDARETEKLKASQVFSFLVRQGFFRSGVSLRCVHCYLQDWHALKELDDVWLCRFCRASNAASPEFMSDVVWRFRKSGLLAKDNNQEGAIPVILTLLMLDEMFGNGSFVWSFSLDLQKGQKKCEVDFCTIVDAPESQDVGPEIAIGECKSDGGQIEGSDIENLVRVAQDLGKLDVVPFVVFAKTSGGFAAAEIARFRDLRSGGLDCVLLSNRELESAVHYMDDGEDVDVKTFPHSLREMAEITCRRYLD